MSATIAEPVDRVHARQQMLQQHVLLLSPTFGCWRGYYQLSEHRIDVKLDEQTVESGDVTTPRSILMKDDCPLDSTGKAWKKRFREIENRQKGLVESFSIPFSIRGVRIIPKSRGHEFFEALIGPVNEDGVPIGKRDSQHQLLPLDQQSVAYQLAAIADEFCNSLSRVYQQIRDSNPKVWEIVSDRLPQTPADMREKFYVDATPIELGGGSGSEVNLEELANHNATVRNAIHRKVEEAVESMVAAPRAELAEALANLQELIARDGNVTAKSFKPIRAAIAKIRLFDFVADADLLARITELEGRLNITTPTQLDSVTAANNGFLAALRSVQDEVTSAERQAANIEEFGRDFRGIDLD